MSIIVGNSRLRPRSAQLCAISPQIRLDLARIQAIRNLAEIDEADAARGHDFRALLLRFDRRSCMLLVEVKGE